jgi:DNA-binding CsgD family transcriptional regulator
MTRRTVGEAASPTTDGPNAAGRTPDTAQAAEAVEGADPDGADVARRLRDLSAPARRLVEVGAVFGSSFAVTDVAEVIGQPAGGLLDLVQEAVDAGALVAGSDVLAFRHDAIRRGAYETVPAAVRLALHRQIGDLHLRRRNWPSAAEHLVYGVAKGDRIAAAGLEQAAREVQPSAPAWACELALRALDITDPDDADRFGRAATAVEALVAAGRLEEADYLARRALGSHGVPAPTAARLRLALAELALVTGRPRAALDDIESVASDPAVPVAFHAPAEVSALWATLALDDVPAARRQVELILSGGAGRDQFLPTAMAALAVLTWRDGRVADALALARAAVARGDRRQTPNATDPFQRLCLGWMLAALGDLDGAVEIVDALSDEVGLAAHALWSPAPAALAARVELAAGRLEDASAAARAAIDLATELGSPYFLAGGSVVLAELAVMNGELTDAASRIDCTQTDVAWPPWGASSCRLAAARLCEATGGPGRVLEQAADVYDDVDVDARLLLDDPLAAAWLVRTALEAGDQERADRVVAQAERLELGNPSFPTVVASCRHAQGLVRDDPTLVREAGELHRHPRARATAWEDAGVLSTPTDRKAARELLERAVSAYEELGVERDAARVRSRLRAIGVHWRHGRRADRPVSGWDSLTDTEREVAELVAEGLTNAQIAERMYVSRHTIDFYLRQIFRKLGIESRVALARLHLERVHDDDANDYAPV